MTNYDKGRRFEYAVRDHLRDNGYDVIRSAGSKTKTDLIAIKPGQILFVQCKVNGRIGVDERADLVRIAGCVDGWPVVAWRHKGIRLKEIVQVAPPTYRTFAIDEVA